MSAASTYFRVLGDDKRYPDRWFLGDPISGKGKLIDPREFTYGRHYTGPIPIEVMIGEPGVPVGFLLAAFDMPVVSDQVAVILTSIAPRAVECFPVRVESIGKGYQIVNVVVRKDCVDEGRCSATRWAAGDGRPDKVGQYRQIYPLKIDARRANGAEIFRVSGLEIALIVCERIVERLSGINGLGVVFQAVN